MLKLLKYLEKKDWSLMLVIVVLVVTLLVIFAII